MEIWREIKEFPGYEISTHGRVRSWRKRGNKPGRREKPILMKQGVEMSGYKTIFLRKPNVSKRFRVHRLMLTVFVGDCPAGFLGCHNDGNPLNNKLENLRWGSKQDNAMDMCRHGNSRSKLTIEEVRRIRNSAKSNTELAKEIGVDRKTVRSARIGATWSWV